MHAFRINLGIRHFALYGLYSKLSAQTLKVTFFTLIGFLKVHFHVDYYSSGSIFRNLTFYKFFTCVNFDE